MKNALPFTMMFPGYYANPAWFGPQNGEGINHETR